MLLTFTHLLTFSDGLLIGGVGVLCVLFIRHRKGYRVSSVKISFPFSLGNITLETTDIDRVIAWKLYTQLKTRKAAIIFDEQYDVIDKIYDSLYEIFQVSRDLLMNLPLYEIQRQPNISDLVFRVLNDGLRPHLTKWQPDFHKWWVTATNDPKNSDKCPQEIQKCYPKYSELIKDLKLLNAELDKYAQELFNIVIMSGEKKNSKLPELKPIQPTSSEPEIAANTNINQV